MAFQYASRILGNEINFEECVYMEWRRIGCRLSKVKSNRIYINIFKSLFDFTKKYVNTQED